MFLHTQLYNNRYLHFNLYSKHPFVTALKLCWNNLSNTINIYCTWNSVFNMTYCISTFPDYLTGNNKDTSLHRVLLEADSHWCGRAIVCYLWNLNIQYYVHNTCHWILSSTERSGIKSLKHLIPQHTQLRTFTFKIINKPSVWRQSSLLAGSKSCRPPA
jgi:hypothetical protein